MITGICIKCYANSFNSTTYELKDCDSIMCWGISQNNQACDSCYAQSRILSSMNSSRSEKYGCISSAFLWFEILSISQNTCKDISEELNEKLEIAELRALEELRPLGIETQEQIDRWVKGIKDLTILKFCLCSTDGCNDPDNGALNDGDGGNDGTNNAGERAGGALIPILVAACIFKIM